MVKVVMKMELVELIEGALDHPFFPKGKKVRALFGLRVLTSSGYAADVTEPSTGVKCFCGGKIILAEIGFPDHKSYGLFCKECQEEYAEDETLKGIYEILHQNFVS